VRLSAQALRVPAVGVIAAVATEPAKTTPATNAPIVFEFFMKMILSYLPEIFLILLMDLWGTSSFGFLTPQLSKRL
jgi:hypothetical protein